MKFSVSVNNKKCTSKMKPEERNKINNLVPGQEDKTEHINKQIISQPDADCNVHDSVTNFVNTNDPVMNFNDNNMATQNNNCTECINNSETSENCDTDNKFFSLLKRISFDRSISWDDSGFNSCTSDDRDDVSERLSFDLTFSDDDENLQTIRQFPLRLRQRSYSLESESSEFSDSHFHNSRKLSSSVNNSELEKSLMLWREKPFIEDATLAKNLAKTAEEKRPSGDKKVEDAGVPVPAARPAITRRRRVGKDVNNNNRSDSILKNLKSFHKPSTSKMNIYFQDHGLLTLVACIVYTLLLVFISGFCRLLFKAIRSLMSKENLQDLRESVARSRQPEKLQLVNKDKSISAHRQRNVNKS